MAVLIEAIFEYLILKSKRRIEGEAKNQLEKYILKIN